MNKDLDLPEGTDVAKDFQDRFPPYPHSSWRVPAPPVSQRIWVNALLFVATVGSTMIAGALQKGVNPFTDPKNVLEGLPFSATLLGILLLHELGHYFTSHYHGVPASLPYFIPVPTLIGTMGAVIRMRSPVRDRRILFDIGIAGPLAGLCLALPAVILGISWSELIPMDSGKGGIELGDSLLFMALTKWIVGRIPEGYTVLLHPVAFAGWLGFFVTSLNLFPIGQLDGGHIVYGILGPRHRMISRVVFLGLVAWGIHGVFFKPDLLGMLWALVFFFVAIRAVSMPLTRPALLYALAFVVLIIVGEDFAPDTTIWLGWAALMTFLRLDHPPTWDVKIPLDPKRTLLGWIALAILVITFVPLPFRMILP